MNSGEIFVILNEHNKYIRVLINLLDVSRNSSLTKEKIIENLNEFQEKLEDALDQPDQPQP